MSEINFDDINLLDFRTNKVEYLRIILCLFIFISLISQGSFDPSPFNLLWPYIGIQNWFSLPGAIFAGSLFDFFGLSAFLIPLSLVTLKHKFNNNLFLLFINLLLQTLFISMFLALFFPKDSEQLINLTGFWGYLTNINLNEIWQRIVGLIISLSYLIFSFKNYQINWLVFSIVGKISLKIIFYIGHRLNFIFNLFNHFKEVNTDSFKTYLSPFKSNSAEIKNNDKEEVKIKKRSGLFNLFDSVKTQSTTKKDSITSKKSVKKATDQQDLLQNALKEYQKSKGDN